MYSNRLKYKTYLDQFPNCPPEDYQERAINAYRWIHKAPDENKNFLPVLLQNPKRQLDTDDQQCMGYGLSFFDTLDNAFAKHQKICRKPSLRKIFGEQIAEILIETQDGVCGQPEEKNTGHFTFHEYKETNLAEKIVNKIELFDEYGNYNR